MIKHYILHFSSLFVGQAGRGSGRHNFTFSILMIILTSSIYCQELRQKSISTNLLVLGVGGISICPTIIDDERGIEYLIPINYLSLKRSNMMNWLFGFQKMASLSLTRRKFKLPSNQSGRFNGVSIGFYSIEQNSEKLILSTDRLINQKNTFSFTSFTGEVGYRWPIKQKYTISASIGVGMRFGNISDNSLFGKLLFHGTSSINFGYLF